MYKIISAKVDKNGKAALIEAINEETGEISNVVLSADFVFKAKNELAAEFAEFMKAKGYDIKTK